MGIFSADVLPRKYLQKFSDRRRHLKHLPFFLSIWKNFMITQEILPKSFRYFFFLPMSIQENLNIFSRIDVGRLCMFFLPASCRAPADVLQMKSWHKLSHRCRHVPIGRNFMIRQKNYPKMNFKSFYTHRVFDTIFFCFGQMKAYR